MSIRKEQAERKLASMVPDSIKTLSAIFKANNYQLFLVGGCVRDTMLGKQPKDFDLCTDAMPDQILDMLSAVGVKNQLLGEHFGVVVAQMEDNYEIATFRIDLNDSSDRNTSVKLGVTINEDCLRRDFTINAMYFDLDSHKIIDLVGGVEDLLNKIIRCVGNPQARFNEDNLRKLRAVRFATRLGFALTPETYVAITNDPTLNVTTDRIFNELFTAYNSTNDKIYLLELLYRTTLIKEIFPIAILNTLKEIELNKLFTFNLFVASIICPCNDNISDYLWTRKLPRKTCNSVDFLINENPGKKIIQPLAFYNKRRSTDLENDEIEFFHNNSLKIRWLTNFVPYEGLADKLMLDGYLNKELGDKLKAIYEHDYLNQAQ